MGIFSNFFNKLFAPAPPLEETAESKTPLGQPLFTNAPAHWGIVTDEFLGTSAEIANGWEGSNTQHNKKQRFMTNSLMLAGSIGNALAPLNKGVKPYSSYGDGLHEFKEPYATSCCIDKLFSKGIIKINGIIIDNYQRYGVVLFDSPTPMKYYQELRDLFLENGYKDLIYYAVVDPATVTQEAALMFSNFEQRSFRFDLTKQGAQDRKFDEYALWWASIKQPDFLNSSVCNDVGICLDILDHHHSYALGVLSMAFGLKKDNTRLRLPEQEQVLLYGPEQVEILMTLSESRGIHFHFPVNERYEHYRDNFIKVYLRLCYDLRAQILEGDLPPDDFGQPSSYEWFKSLITEVRQKDNLVIAVGSIVKMKWNNFHLN